jgi:hypothetical protein
MRTAAWKPRVEPGASGGGCAGSSDKERTGVPWTGWDDQEAAWSGTDACEEAEANEGADADTDAMLRVRQVRASRKRAARAGA